MEYIKQTLSYQCPFSLDLKDSQLMQAVIVVAVHQVQAVVFVVIWTTCPVALKKACLGLSMQ